MQHARSLFGALAVSRPRLIGLFERRRRRARRPTAAPADGRPGARRRRPRPPARPPPRGQRRPGSEPADRRSARRGRAQHHHLGGLRRGRLERQGIRLGPPVRGGQPGLQQVNVKPADTSDEMVTLMRQGGGTVYDGVSASGDASNRLIANGDVAPINVDLIPDFKDIAPFLQSPAAQHGQRQALRRVARLGRQHADVPDRPGHAGADELGRRSSTRPRSAPTRARSPTTTARSTSPTRRST